jgi:hypothetical protein
MAVLDPQAFDQLRGGSDALGELLAHAVAQFTGQGVDLTTGRGSVALHAAIRAAKSARLCADSVPTP